MVRNKLMLGYMLFGVYIVFTVTGLILIKVGASSNGISLQKSIFTISLSCWFILGMVCYICSFLLFSVVLVHYNLSFIYPLAGGISMILTVLAGVMFLKEKLSVQNIIGIAIIVLGVFIMNWKSGGV
jgi:multidrug transporter EmrE-like cation transporter